MVQSNVKYKVLPSDVQDVNESDFAEEDDDEITIHFQAPFNQQRGRRKSDTYIRVMVALILLGIVCVFMVCEWNGYWSEEKEHDHHYNQDIDNDDTDHNHKEGDDHHNHHNHTHEHSEPLYHHAAVITDSEICSRMGKELLEASGNVVDAAIAALLCIGIVHPHTAGLGGAFSAILYNHTLKSFKAIHDTSQKLPAYSAPSLLQGLRLLHSNYGHLEWSALFEGAAKLAKNFSIDGILSRALESHKDKILQSKLCDVFCHADGRVKSEGADVANGKLSELLLSVGQNVSHFSEMLAVKLAQDISEAERPAFLAAARAGTAEINEPLIVKQEKYTILSAPSQLTGVMVSRILDAVRERNLSFQNNGELNDTASYNALLNLAKEFFNASQNHSNLRELLALNTSCSHIGVLDSHNNFIVISTSLNSTWGSGRYLPQSGVVLSDFISDITQLPYFSFPLVVKIDEEDDGDDGHSDVGHEEEEHEMQLVAVTGGLSALFQSVVMLRNLLDFDLSAQETVNRPLLYIEQREPNILSGCMSVVTNSFVLSEGNGQLQVVGECSGPLLSMLLQLKAGHVGVYGSPTTEVHTDGID
ncbi:Glutathione hydrolase 6 [Triplophysa tibetana]|uniref:Glutathione hydrolase 6 n=1 Tax=Triplophysa tibetana TaxID=1572043 RepID=A0A5A9P9N4_9TELE|nr:Glutathione hydrolase 6 [Triplophysa tibetana]